MVGCGVRLISLPKGPNPNLLQRTLTFLEMDINWTFFLWAELGTSNEARINDGVVQSLFELETPLKMQFFCLLLFLQSVPAKNCLICPLCITYPLNVSIWCLQCFQPRGGCPLSGLVQRLRWCGRWLQMNNQGTSPLLTSEQKLCWFGNWATVMSLPFFFMPFTSHVWLSFQRDHIQVCAFC